MKHISKHQRGQALVLIVFAIVGMIGLTGLAIDGGNVYSDHRHAQNAADTAALAAGLRLIRSDPSWVQAAQNVAQDNGYPPASADSIVDVYKCDQVPSGKPPCVLAPGEANPSWYVQVVITSTVHTYFAPVVGIRTVVNQVEAIAKAVPPTSAVWYSGDALVALMPGCKSSGWNADPFTISGSQVSLVNGSGIYVNSTCSNAFVQNGNNSLTSPGGICVRGGVSSGLNNVTPNPTANCTSQMDMSEYNMPAIDPSACAAQGHIANGYAYPGTYNGVFPPGQSGSIKLLQGIYCLQNGMSVQGGWSLSTDLNSDGVVNANEGALFYVEHGGVNISGNSSMFLGAINNTSTGLGPGLVNYLMYVPPTNTSSVKITGGSANTYVGTILAPASLVTLDGGSGTTGLNMQTQVIGYSLVLTGSSNLNITYNTSQNAIAYTNPSLTQYK